MGRPLAGSELRGAFISDPQVRPRCLSCQNSPIQHCAEFINAALTHTQMHTTKNGPDKTGCVLFFPTLSDRFSGLCVG